MCYMFILLYCSDIINVDIYESSSTSQTTRSPLKWFWFIISIDGRLRTPVKMILQIHMHYACLCVLLSQYTFEKLTQFHAFDARKS